MCGEPDSNFVNKQVESVDYVSEFVVSMPVHSFLIYKIQLVYGGFSIKTLIQTAFS